MDKNKIPVLEILATILLAAIVITMVYIYFPNGKIGDAATWAGALGAFLAFGGAIWIATTETRRRHADELVVAKLTAAGMTMRLAILRGELKRIVGILERASTVDTFPLNFEAIADLLAKHAEWNPDEVVRLVPLPNHCAYKLAGGFDRLGAVSSLARDVHRASPSLVSGGHMEASQKLLFALNEAYKLISIATDECQKASLALTCPYA